jgi:hypothetical protein
MNIKFITFMVTLQTYFIIDNLKNVCRCEFYFVFVNETIMAYNMIIFQINKLIIKDNETCGLTLIMYGNCHLSHNYRL